MIRTGKDQNIKIVEVRRLRTKVATARCCLLVCSRDHLGTKYQLLKEGRHNSKRKIYPEFAQQRKHDDSIVDLEKVEYDTVEDIIFKSYSDVLTMHSIMHYQNELYNTIFLTTSHSKVLELLSGIWRPRTIIFTEV